MGRVFDGEELYVKKKVMTDEQLEVLRHQISAYTTICEQLVHMHNSITAQQDHLAGMRLCNTYYDPMMTPSTGHKIGTRQRWAPTPAQLQTLERIFDQGSGTPGKQRVKEITNELSQHGSISETNVYNWFQNRRARSKRKQLVGVQSEAEGEIDSPKVKKSKAENFGPSDTSANQSPELSDDLHCFDAQLIRGDSIFEVFDHVALFESFPRMDYMLEKMEAPECFAHYQLGEEFGISG